MIVRVGAGLDEEQVIREVRRALHDPEVDTLVLHKPGSEALLMSGEEMVVDAGGHWIPKRSVAQADGAGV